MRLGLHHGFGLRCAFGGSLLQLGLGFAQRFDLRRTLAGNLLCLDFGREELLDLHFAFARSLLRLRHGCSQRFNLNPTLRQLCKCRLQTLPKLQQLHPRRVALQQQLSVWRQGVGILDHQVEASVVQQSDQVGAW